MTKIPNAVTSLPRQAQVAALLTLGWTHEEIVTATGASKGSIQNYKEKMRNGELSPPPEVFDIIRSRMREIHRACRNSDEPNDEHIEQLAERLKTLNELELLEIHENGRITYQDLVAFAELIAGQVADDSMQGVVDELGDLHSLGSDVSTIRCILHLRYAHFQANLLRFKIRIERIQRRYSEAKKADKPLKTEKTEGLKGRGSKFIGGHKNKVKPTETDQLIKQDNKWVEKMELESHVKPIRFGTNTKVTGVSEEECKQRGGIYDPNTGICHLRDFNMD